MAWYVDWVKNNVLLSAFIQFAILGTLGELLGVLAAKRKPSAKVLEWLAKAVVWGFLGILVKYSFKGFSGYLEGLVHAGFLPAPAMEPGFLRAFLLSVAMNAQFGPLLMFIHRSTDNLISGARGYQGIRASLTTLAWFWVPAHTLTFMLPQEYQIGLAALWSVALGLIMGWTKRPRSEG
ncbi:MAG: hypothetical protein JW923_03595 [Spirochaetales bacterium]|nr:hypothetical protein [Spirochaetales bacterium]